METVDECSAEQTRHDPNADTAANEEEMPLLFMDGLPSNFHQNAELAAIATFMDSADEEENDDEEASGNGSKQRRQRHDTSMKTVRRRQRYAKLTPKDMKKRKRDKATTSDTKELQLFLSMFHVS